MDEHIFKMRVTKWEEGAASLHGSYDDLYPPRTERVQYLI